MNLTPVNLGYPHGDGCLGCRLVKRLDIVDDAEVLALHNLAILHLQRRDLIRQARSRGFVLDAPRVLSTMEDEAAQMAAVHAPYTTTLN